MSIKKLKVYEDNMELRPTLETEEEDLPSNPEDIYDWVGALDAQALRLVKLNGLYGMIDVYNNEFIPPLYTEIYPEDSFFTRVAGRDNRYVLINRFGKEVSDLYLTMNIYSDSFGNRGVKFNNMYGLINQYGEEILPPIYTSITSADSDGNRVLYGVNKRGTVDKEGNITWSVPKK